MPSVSHATIDSPVRDEFESLYREHFAFVWRTLRRFGVADTHLEDTTQEVFLIAHRRAGAWAEWSSPRAWLFGVARRVAADHRRGRDRHARKLAALPELDAPSWPPPADGQPPPSLEDHLDEKKRLRAVIEAIAALAPDRRTVYVLAEIEGLSAPEIAQACEIKLNTVYSRLRRARDDVAGWLDAAGLPVRSNP
jgi:RNA polymerase sigma-70 factor (ECF subfamily)